MGELIHESGRLELPQPVRVVLATRNAKKGIEMAQLLAGPKWQLLTLLDWPDPCPDVEETGCTYEENALLKAHAAARATGCLSVADDAGLEIDALDGQPGVHSHRFLGEDTPFPEKMAKILRLLEGAPEDARGCRFRAAVAIAAPSGEQQVCHGVCEGRIAHEMRGSNGFGYDPIFYVPSLGRHMAELTPDEKHAISHRGQALSCVRRALDRWLVFPLAGSRPLDMGRR